MWKSFFILIMLFLFIVIFAGGVIETVNLTNTPLAPTSAALNTNRTTLLGGAAQPGLVGQGGCGGSYTVRAGDTLSTIAQGCGVALKDLIAANPGLANPNLIHPGQVIVMAAPRPAASPQPTAAPLPAAVEAAPSLTAVPAIRPLVVATVAPMTPTSSNPAVQGAPNNPTPVPTVRPGGAFDVHLRGFPPNAAVAILLGPLGFAPSEIGRGVADAQGVYNGSVKIPTSALPGTQWRVTVQTLVAPVIKVNSPTIIIQP